jgi:hypothetical protein
MSKINPYESPRPDSPAPAEYFGHTALMELTKSHILVFQPHKQIIAVTELGIIYVEQKPLKRNSDPKQLPWSNVDQVVIRQKLSTLGLLYGFAGLLIVSLMIYRAITAQSSTLFSILRIAVILVILPEYMRWMLGIRRNEVTILSGKSKFSWISAPLKYRKTLAICQQITRLCREKSVVCDSHTDSEMENLQEQKN